MGFSTDCIHAGQEPEPVTGAVTYPIFQTSTYVQPELGKHKGYEYARTKNPTRSVLEAALAALERGKHGHCFASGMSAIDVVFRMLQSGDHVIAGENMYGGSSSGANVTGALQVAQKLGPGKRVVTIIPDGAERYMSKGIFTKWR